MPLSESIFKFKSPFCLHEKSCLHNCLKGALSAFGKAFLAKLCLNVLFTLLSMKKILKDKNILSQILKSLVNKTNMSLGLFMGLQTLLLKGIQCLLRLLRQKEDGWNAITSGAIAGGLSYLTQEDAVKYTMRVYMFGRAFDCLYQSQVQEGPWKNNIIIPQIIFGLMSGIISYGYFYEPDVVPMDTIKLYDKFGHRSLNDKIWHMCNIQGFRNRKLFNN